MEQNQTTPTQPVNPVVEALEKAEPVQSTPTPMQAAPAPKKKSSATVLSIILLLILALGGIGFGVWAMMDKNNQVDKLNKQIQDLRNSISDITPSETDESDSSDSTSGVELNADEYIYNVEWGIKIKKPTNWSEMIHGWDISFDRPHAVDSFAIYSQELTENGVAKSVFISYYGEQSCEDSNIVSQSACIKVGDKYYSINAEYAPDAMKTFFIDPANYSEI